METLNDFFSHCQRMHEKNTVIRKGTPECLQHTAFSRLGRFTSNKASNIGPSLSSGSSLWMNFSTAPVGRIRSPRSSPPPVSPAGDTACSATNFRRASLLIAVGTSSNLQCAVQHRVRNAFVDLIQCDAVLNGSTCKSKWDGGRGRREVSQGGSTGEKREEQTYQQ